MILANQTFPENRIRAGYSISELARTAGLSVQTVSCLERGGTLSPSAAHKLCEALGASFDDLFEITNSPQRKSFARGRKISHKIKNCK